MVGKALTMILSKKRKRRWLVDLDGIGADIYSDWLGIYNTENGTSFTTADIKDWDITTLVPADKKDELRSIIRRPGFFRNLRPLPGFIEGLRTMQEELDIEVHLASAPAGPLSAKEKLEWCEEHLPFISERRVALIHDKWMLGEADGLIDDGPHNIGDYRKHHPAAQVLSIAYPFNAHVADRCDLRAEGWQDTAAAWRQTINHVRSFCER